MLARQEVYSRRTLHAYGIRRLSGADHEHLAKQKLYGPGATCITFQLIAMDADVLYICECFSIIPKAFQAAPHAYDKQWHRTDSWMQLVAAGLESSERGAAAEARDSDWMALGQAVSQWLHIFA